MKPKEVFSSLKEIYRENKMAHAYLLETNDINNCLSDLKNLIKTFFSSYDNINTLIDKNLLPSLQIIEPQDRTIKKDQIDNLKNNFSLSSQYTEKSIYIIISPEKMNSTAYNKMLKFLEEPENNIIGFFITNSKEDIASTIVSRLEILRVFYSDYNLEKSLNISDDLYSLLNNYANIFINNIELDYFEAIMYNNDVIEKEISEKKDLIAFLKIVYNKYQNSMDKYKNVLKKLKVINDALDKIQYNVNNSLLMTSLIIKIGELNE